MEGKSRSTRSWSSLTGNPTCQWIKPMSDAMALKHLRAMKRGDLTFVYHTGDEKQIVGVADVTSDPYPDPKEKDPKLVVVELKPRERLPRAVTLAEVKTDAEFQSFELVRMGRLSVMPVSDARWKRLLRMAGSK